VAINLPLSGARCRLRASNAEEFVARGRPGGEPRGDLRLLLRASNTCWYSFNSLSIRRDAELAVHVLRKVGIQVAVAVLLDLVGRVPGITKCVEARSAIWNPGIRRRGISDMVSMSTLIFTIADVYIPVSIYCSPRAEVASDVGSDLTLGSRVNVDPALGALRETGTGDFARLLEV
jgi:hypothetical protein